MGFLNLKFIFVLLYPIIMTINITNLVIINFIFIIVIIKINIIKKFIKEFTLFIKIIFFQRFNLSLNFSLYPMFIYNTFLFYFDNLNLFI